MSLRARTLALPLALTAASMAMASHAHAAGFYLTDRGVRALGRAGAFVAGADDAHAIWYNPAGLTEAGRSFLLDASLILYGNRFQRQACAEPDCLNTTVPAGESQGTATPFPLPTLVVTHDLGVKKWNFAAGLFAPNAVITSYNDGPDAPQRYSLYSLNGSILASAGVWAAWKPDPKFSVGFGLQALFGSFSSRLALSACPATVTCAPEDPQWDALAQLDVGPIFAPSGNVGVRIQPIPQLVIGISGQLPFWISAPASLKVRLPSAAYFDGAQVQGDRAGVAFTLAPVVRAGVEVRPDPFDRIEVAFVFEGWGVHDKIALTPDVNENQPGGIRITNVRGVGTYQVGGVNLDRHFQHTYSVRAGYERIQPIGKSGWSIAPRAGVSYETSSTAPEYTSVLTMDTNKWLLSLGAGVGKGGLRVDAVFAAMIASSVEVAPVDAKIYQTQPFRTNMDAIPHAINGGRYDLSTFVIGLGLKYAF